MTVDLTVGIPVYNAARTLRETLDSLLAQTYSAFEILVSDNASTDETPDILADYASRDSRLRFVRQRVNRGAIENFQYVLEAARTPLFSWFAADDLCAPTFLERTREAVLGRPQAVIAAADVCAVDERGTPKRIVEQPEIVGLNAERRMHVHLATYGWYATYGVGRRDKFLACGAFPKAFGADVIKTAEWMLAGDIVRVPEPLFIFRERSGGKDPATYVEQFNPGTRTPARPHSEMLRGVAGAIRRAQLGPALERDVLATAVRTVAFENLPFVNEILREHELVASEIDDLARLRLVREIVDDN
jgi:glycosyltransferase involved in cell wall biosynthesis